MISQSLPFATNSHLLFFEHLLCIKWNTVEKKGRLWPRENLTPCPGLVLKGMAPILTPYLQPGTNTLCLAPASILDNVLAIETLAKGFHPQ